MPPKPAKRIKVSESADVAVSLPTKTNKKKSPAKRKQKAKPEQPAEPEPAAEVTSSAASSTKPGPTTVGKRRRTLPVRPARQGGHCVLISHLPDGLREPQLRRFLSQFGRVSRVRVPRAASGAGNAKGVAFVEMADPLAAKVVAETLDSYLMFNRLLKCKVIADPKRLTFATDGRLRKPKASQAAPAVNAAADARGRQRRLRAKLHRLKQLDPEFEFS